MGVSLVGGYVVVRRAEAWVPHHFEKDQGINETPGARKNSIV
jgi:hypothetical protein